MAKKRKYFGVAMRADGQSFFCQWHRRYFPAEKLLVCAVRNCRWRYECQAEDARRIQCAEKRREHARRRVAGVGAAG